MAKGPNQKLKIMYLNKMLLEKTDENHPMGVNDMIAELGKLGVNAERKTIYDDLALLRDVYGTDIIAVRGKHQGYYVGERDFELAELKLLADSVAAAKFISGKKSLSLISKIEKLASVHDAKKLRRQVYVTNRVKTGNESVYYNVDTIHAAIASNFCVSFKYFDITVGKRKKYRKDGEFYTETPVALMCDDGNYYLVAYKRKYANYVHYRVDRMSDVTVTDIPRDMPDEKFDPAEYAKSVFSMFGGERERIDIRFDMSLLGAVYDKFGTGIAVRRLSDDSFAVTLAVEVSDQFFAWVAGFGTRAKIIEPMEICERFGKFLIDIAAEYEA